MTIEMLRIFDEEMNCIGEKAREEIHRDGDWHETFHCWFSIRKDEVPYVFFQKRSNAKKDYPGLYDITSAGHLLAAERVEDGIREVEEELGIGIEYNCLTSLGVLKEEIKTEHIHDREFSHVFLYECTDVPQFILQKEEVDGVYIAPLEHALSLFTGTMDELDLIGIEGGETVKSVRRADFVGHAAYYAKVFKRIKEHLAKRRTLQE